MSDRPNILFLMADQMQGRILEPDHVFQTPHLDRLAREGVRFTRAYTPNNICSPTRASLMTGLMPHNHGVLEVLYGKVPDLQVKAHSQLKLVGLRDLLMRFAEHSGHRDSGRFSAPA